MTEPEKPEKERTKLRLRIHEVAEAKKVSMALLARRADLGMSVVQRMWHNSGRGVVGGDPLESISLRALEQIAKILDVHPRDLICWEEELKPRALRKRASRN